MISVGTKVDGMRLLTSFRVGGTPQQQGSKSPQGWETNKKLKPWRLLLKDKAADHYTETPYDGAVKVVAIFEYHRPKAHFMTNGIIRPTAPMFKSTMPDLDKLQRAVGDSLTGVVITDDSRIASWSSIKTYATQDGLRLEVWALEDVD